MKKIPTFYLRSAANNIRFPDPVSVFVVTLHFPILLIQLVLYAIGILFTVYSLNTNSPFLCYMNSDGYALLYKMPSNRKGKNFVSKFPGYCPPNTMVFFSSKLDGIKK